MPVRSQLQQIDAIYQSAPIGLCVLDRDLRYLRINEHLARINGVPVDEHLGRTVRDVLPDVADVVEGPLRRVVDAAEPIEGLEIEGGGRTVVLHCHPLRDEHHEVIGVNIVVEEITERKRMERALRESEARFHALADNIAQLAWMADGSGSVFWYNRRWLEYTGMALEDMLGWGWRAVHHPDYVDAVVEKIRKSFDTGQPWEDTFPLRAGDGTYRWFLSRAMPIRDDEGRIVLWVGTNTDVTQGRMTEEMLVEADRRKDEFLALLGHELRDPLAPILMAAKFLQVKSQSDERLQKATETIVRQAQQLAALVDDLLDVARIAAGKLRLQKARVDLKAIVMQAAETCAPAIERRRHRIEIVVPDTPVHVEVDAGRIVQVICNLLNNAAKYMDDGGSIVLTASEQRGAAVISVRDRGVGIPPEMLGRIFERFVQLGTTARREDGGLGMGLSLVKSLVTMHGGTVEARSDGAGKGSEFIVRLPLSADDDGDARGMAFEPAPTPSAP